MQLDTLEGISELLNEMGYQVLVKDVDIDDYNLQYMDCINGSQHLVTGPIEKTVNITLALIPNQTDPHLDSIKEAVHRFDESVRPLMENL